MVKPFNEYDVTLNLTLRPDMGHALRYSGTAKLKNVVQLIEVLDLDSNPRDSKLTEITNDIKDTLENSPELYALKSKGILLATSNFNPLDRDRFELAFHDTKIAGVLDGGHNLLAIGLFFLEQVLDDAEDRRELRKAKIWSAFKEIFNKHKPLITEFLNSDDPCLNIPVPIELLVPRGQSELEVENFERILIEIQDARNNNAELRQETRSNNAGYFDDLKKSVDPEIRSRIEWKSNDGGHLPVSSLIALTWIPLSLIDNEKIVNEDNKRIDPPSPAQIYNSKAIPVSKFDSFMRSSEVTISHKGQAELRNSAVRSALEIAGRDMPRIWDLVSAKFPQAYNNAGGSYGRITAVAAKNKSDKPKTARFTNTRIDYTAVDGFITPIVFAFKALLGVDKDGLIYWKTDPFKFFESNLETLVKPFIELIKEEPYQYDPQKVGKSSLAYTTCLNQFEITYLRQLGS